MRVRDHFEDCTEESNEEECAPYDFADDSTEDTFVGFKLAGDTWKQVLFQMGAFLEGGIPFEFDTFCQVGALLSSSSQRTFSSQCTFEVGALFQVDALFEVSALFQVESAHLLRYMIYTFIYIYIYTYIYIYIYIYTYIYTYIYKYIYIHIFIFNHTHLFAHLQMYIHTDTYVYAQTHTWGAGKESCIYYIRKIMFRTINSSLRYSWLCVHRGLCWCVFLSFLCVIWWRVLKVGHGELKCASESIIQIFVLWSMGEKGHCQLIFLNLSPLRRSISIVNRRPICVLYESTSTVDIKRFSSTMNRIDRRYRPYSPVVRLISTINIDQFLP